MSKTALLVTSEFLPGPGGIGRHAFQLATQLTINGFRVRVITELREQFGRKEFANMEVVYVPRLNRFHSIYFGFRIFIEICHRPSVVIASGVKSLMSCWPGIFLTRVMAILHGHELLMGSGWFRKVLGQIVRRYRVVVAVSEFAKTNSQKELGTKRITVIPNGVEVAEGQMIVKTERSTQAMELLTVGTISPRKGQHNVIANLMHARKVYSDIRYTAVGLIREPDLAYQQMNRDQSESFVVFTGALTDEQLEEKYRYTSVVVMLSENQKNGDVEGFGISILEANMRGIPAIGARGCGIEQAIQDGYNGILIDSNDPEQFINALSAIDRDYAAYSERAIAWAKAHDWKKIGLQYIHALEKEVK